MHMLLPALMFALLLFAGPVIALANAQPVDSRLTAAVTAGGPLHLVILPPWAEEATLLARAEARAVGPLRAPIGIFAHGPGPDLSARLYRAGAWAVLDGRRLAMLCGG